MEHKTINIYDLCQLQVNNTLFLKIWMLNLNQLTNINEPIFWFINHVIWGIITYKLILKIN